LETATDADETIRSSLGFFYGARWAEAWQRFDDQLETATDQLEELCRVFQAISEQANADPHRAFRDVSRTIATLADEMNRFARSSKALDVAADVVIEVMRGDFKAVSF
jgi:hypothetical protein